MIYTRLKYATQIYKPGNILFAPRSISELERVGLSSPPDAEYTSPQIVRLDGKPDRWTPEHLYREMALDKLVDTSDSLNVKLADLESGT